MVKLTIILTLINKINNENDKIDFFCIILSFKSIKINLSRLIFKNYNKKLLTELLLKSKLNQ